MKKAHFVGICGVGMSATAVLLKEKGWEVSGSDSGCFDPIKSYLIDQKIPFVEGFDVGNIPVDVDLVVGGGSAKLADNVEIVAARERDIEVKTFPEVIADISKDQETVLVVGSYGKSTMSSLIARILAESGKDPSWFTGAPPIGDPSSQNSVGTSGLASHLGTGRFFVVEADEYPTSGIDSRSKFLHFKADNIILIAGEHDHVNVFPTPERYREPFKQLLAKVPTSGTITACIDNPGVLELIAPHLDKTTTYGLNAKHDPVWSAENVVRAEVTTATITQNRQPVCEISTTLLGDHNIQNIVGAAAFLVGHDIVTAEEFAKGVATFKGIKRRLEKKTECSSVPVYEGYGSSIDKARAAINAIKAHFPKRRLVIVFEPHTYSWRNRAMLHWYDDIFRDASLTLVYHPATNGVTSHDQATHEEIMERVIASGANVLAISTPEECITTLSEKIDANDIVLILTSGPMDGLVESIPKLIEEKFPA